MTTARFPSEQLRVRLLLQFRVRDGQDAAGCMDELLDCGLHLTVSLSCYFLLFLCVDLVPGIIFHSK